jgi:hypothetical protein
MPAIKQIRITRAEGPTELCGILQTANTFEEASRILGSIAATAPDSGGYDKTDFIVEFEDGETYAGRADIKRGHLAGYDLREHIASFLGYLGGTRKPTHLNDTLWKQVCARNEASGDAAEARAFVAKYL